MLQQIHVRDKITGRPEPQAALVIDWQASVPLTARMLISERVRIEWDAREDQRKARAAHVTGPLVDAEMMRRLNPYRTAQLLGQLPRSSITLDAVTALAIDGFTRNAFFLVVDDKQVTDLDEVIPLRPTSEVTFVRLIPLKGG